MGKTNWDKIVSDQDLLKARALRSKTYITAKERVGALDALRSEGCGRQVYKRQTK